MMKTGKKELMKLLLSALAAFVFCAVTAAAAAAADDVSFEFGIPYPYFPPEISIVTNTVAKVDSTFTVFANIEGRTQLEPCCNGVCEHQCAPDCDFSACELADFYAEPDPRVVPNPPCIPNAVDSSGGISPDVCGGHTGNPQLYYYFNGDTATTAAVDMVYYPGRQEFKGEIPTTGLAAGDSVNYYIVAADSMGNVVSQAPDPQNTAAGTIYSWDENYATPALDNCSAATAYERCGVIIDGTPGCFSSGWTINDPEGDTCTVDGFATSPQPAVDILGFTASAGKGYQALPSEVVVAAKMRLGEPPPDPGTSHGEINCYQFAFFNPDIPDPNPVDPHFTNAFFVTYAPEVAGADPNLVKVLWDGDCVTDPNTADILGCKIFIGSLNEERMKIGVSGSELAMIVKNSLPDGRTIMGGDSNAVGILALTGYIDLTGDVPFWIVDQTAGMRLIMSNQTTYKRPGPYPIWPPYSPNPADCRWPGGAAFSGTCEQSSSEPEFNECYLTIYPSPDSSFASAYKIYHNTVDDIETATHVHTIDSNLGGINHYTFTWGDGPDEPLDGKTHYFYFTANNSEYFDLETPLERASKTQCTVEDWVAPEPPTGMNCATPPGNEGNCKCTWNYDTVADPSVTGFNITRGGVTQNTNPIPAAEDEASYYYSYTDNDEELAVMGGPYTYRAIATDAGGNESPVAGDNSDTAECIPEDFKKPSKIDTLTPALKFFEYSVDLAWEQGEDDDLASGGGYNVYYCEAPMHPDTDCETAARYTKLNDSLIPHEGTLEYTASDLATEGTEFCFWVEACDNCIAAGTCPGRSEPNCSNFDTTVIYRKCLYVGTTIDCGKPDMPGNVDASPSATGQKCDITFDRVCGGDDGDFQDCNYPGTMDLLGYYVLRTEAVGGDCSTTPIGNPGNLGSSVIAKTVYASQQIDATLETTDDNNGEGLINGTQYCYVVYGYDACSNYSAGRPTPASCTPADTEPPAVPQMQTMVFDEFYCSPSWDAVSDFATVTYNLYRCEADSGECDSTGGFSIIDDSGGTPVGEGLASTSYTHYNVLPGETYKYCVTSVDESGNESDLLPSPNDNCRECTPSDRPASPVASTVWQYSSPNCGAKACWDDSPDYDPSGEGYSIYICSDAECEQKEAGECCERMAEYGYNGSYACTDGNEWTKQDVGALDPDDYYIGVTYVDEHGSESLVSLTENSVQIDYCGPPFDCSYIITLAPPLAKTAIEPCGPDEGDRAACEAAGEGDCTANGSLATMRRCLVPLRDIRIELVPVTSAERTGGRLEYGEPVSYENTDYKGEVDLRVYDSNVEPGVEYVVRARLDEYDAAMAPLCDNDAVADGFCAMNVTEPEEIYSSYGGYEISGSPKPIPMDTADGGLTGDIGNFNADGTVNARDLLKMKYAWMTSAGDPCYRAWADVNMDGRVDPLDLLAIKDYWMKEIDDSAINTGAPGAMIPEDGWPPPECE